MSRASILLDHEEPHLQARKKLDLFVSPEVAESSLPSYSADDPTNGLPKGSERPSDDALPSFRRYEEPSLLEVFYDLFFAANYTVFSQNQSVVNHESFKAYTGYFSLLWATWFAVTLYDVRYVADSLFERITRATQLGVLVGFAVVAPNFDPDKQTDKHTYKTMMAMSFILCFSRFCLAIEYLAVLIHVRRFRRAQLPIVTQAAINATAGAIFLGIAFRFEPGRKSRVFMTWYLVSAAEAILTVIMSNFSRVLGFTRTHLMKRMSLLTIMILGDGIIAVALDVVIIVKTPDAWNAQIIGIVTAASATIYFVFLVYHDWMHHSYLPAIRQQIWTLLHFPFHLSLILFMQGFTQFIVWTKAMGLFNSINDKWLGGGDDDNADANTDWSLVTSQDVAWGYGNATAVFFKSYPPKWYGAWETVDYAISNITVLPNDLWAQIIKYSETEDVNAISDKNWDYAYSYWDAFNAIVGTMANACFQALGLDLTTELRQKYPQEASNYQAGEFQVKVTQSTLQRYHLVFAYTYIAAGCALFFLTILSITTRISRWTIWPVVRTATNLTLSIGVACTATLFLNDERTSTFLDSAWPVPVITMVWLTISITTHIRGGMTAKLRRGKTYIQKKRGKYAAVSVPMTQWTEGDATGKEGLTPESETHRTLSRPASLHDQTAQQTTPYSYGGYSHLSGERYIYSTGHYSQPLQANSPPTPPVPYDPTQTSTAYHGAHGTYQ